MGRLVCPQIEQIIYPQITQISADYNLAIVACCCGLALLSVGFFDDFIYDLGRHFIIMGKFHRKHSTAARHGSKIRGVA